MTTDPKDLCLPYEVSMRDLMEAREAMTQRGKHVLSAPCTKEVDLDLVLLNKFLCEIAVIKYARPFKGSYWGATRFCIPSSEFVPDRHKALHDELITLRDKVIAHSDSKVQNPFSVPGVDTKFIGTTLQAQQILHQKDDDFLDLINTVHQKLTEKTEQLRSSE